MLDKRNSCFNTLHNDANIVSIPARFTSTQAVEIVEVFTEFEGGRPK
jgi:ribose 5-phosphate isomerase RpiB